MCRVRRFARDFLGFAWLESKHAVYGISRAAHFAGTDPRECGGLLERSYQFYVLAFVLLAAVALWSGILDALFGVFAGAEPASAHAVLLCSSLFPVAMAILSLGEPLRGRPLKLRPADSAMVLARPTSIPAFVAVSMVARALGFAVLGGVLGHAVAVVCAAAGLFFPTMDLVLLASAAISLSSVLPAVIGFARAVFTSSFRCRRPWKAAIVVLAGVVAAVGYAALLFLVFAAVRTDMLSGWTWRAAFLFVLVAAVACCCVTSSVADRSFLVSRQGNGVGASGLDLLFMSSIVGSREVKRWRRRSKIAARYAKRPPSFPLLPWKGRFFLVARSLASLGRQREGWARLAVWSLLAVPAWSILLANPTTMPIVAFLAMAVFVLASSDGPDELGWTFSEDMRNPLVTDRVSFSAVWLLALDASVRIVVSSILAIAALVVVSTVVIEEGIQLLWSPSIFVLPLALNFPCAASIGLDFVQVPGKRSLVGRESGLALAFLLAIFGSLSIDGDPALGALCGALFSGVVVLCVVKSRL